MLTAVILGMDEWKRMKSLAASKDVEGIGKFLLDILPPGVRIEDVELRWVRTKAGRVWVEVMDKRKRAA
jgi:hypothetical protein